MIHLLIYILVFFGSGSAYPVAEKDGLHRIET